MFLKTFASVFLALTLSASSNFAAEPSPPNEETSEDSETRSPSPDGHYALRVTRDDDGDMEKARLELIELPAKRVLVVLSDPKYMPDFPTYDATLDWSTDSQRVAFQRGGRRGGTTAIFTRNGNGFAEVKLPDLPNLPDEPSGAMAEKRKAGFPRGDHHQGSLVCPLAEIGWRRSGIEQQLGWRERHVGLAHYDYDRYRRAPSGDD